MSEMPLLRCPRHPIGNCDCMKTEPSADAETYELKPEAGYVFVVRNKVDKHQKNASGEYIIGVNGERLEKHPTDIALEEFRNRHAIIVAIGDTDPMTGVQPTWYPQQKVIIEPTVFREVELENGMSIWLGHFSGIQARLVKVNKLTTDEKAN